MEQLFGNKGLFAIEILIKERIEKSNLRIWINNTPIGYFKRNSSLIYSIKNLKKLIINKDLRFEDFLHQKAATEIFEWILGVDLPKESTVESRYEFQRRHEYVLFWGDQLDEFSTICYFNDSTFYWVIYDVKKKKLLSLESKETVVVAVVEEYITWYENQAN